MTDKRKPYNVTMNSIEHTLLLTDEDAERYGERAVRAAVEEQIEQDGEDAAKVGTKQRAGVANKQRTA